MSDKVIFKRVAIAGVGLIGGSLALAGKKAGIFGTVVGSGRGRANLEAALKLSIVDEITFDLTEAARGADLFFVSTPVESIAWVIQRAAKFLPDGCVITDGGSVKGAIVNELDSELPDRLHFVGGHPVAGTEKTGATAAFAELFHGRYTVLTPTPRTNQEALGKVRAMWEAAGSKVVSMAPEEHDATMSIISHLPHLAVFSLMEAVCWADPEGKMRRFAAGGLRDTTRIAASDPKMWRDIFSMNKDALLDSLTRYQQSLEGFRQSIEASDFDEIEGRIDRISKERQMMDRDDG
ncbi:MAG: prephenate dehydrogenase/arogenate dehydrogenase family protein [Nitrospinota bacterium]|nr:prephenate dehydrogenase/arogenate dehydrogenase family protein [Nitrospinota bacterium]MDH5678154.1 prephenate dehydrogenase/arogenate dehydrogenase family protein [Nitrospinota bacterium]MDH5755175.1 prephenate dehydrogenase/arogenate dehydrogenase family protein [Nitrospinota bacterium]